MVKPFNNTFLNRFAPFIAWLSTYSPSTLRYDSIAGITVSVILIPQSMAYAMLAGLPPVYGLYAAAVTPMIGALWGSLRQLATGPIAIMSLLVLTTLSPLADPGSEEFINMTLLLALMVGIFYLIIGLSQMGTIMSFISHSAVKGFTSAAALIISATQLPHLFGITIGKHEFLILSLVEIIGKLPLFNTATLLIGILSFFTLILAKKVSPKLPAGLIALLLSTLVVILFGLKESGVAVIGIIPQGLPHFNTPSPSFELIFQLIPPAIVLALVSFAETYSVGKAISAETGQRVDVNQEFIGQGLANFVGSFFQCYPVSGSFSRTALNYATGAKTGMSSVISSLIVILVLLFLTPLLTNIPKAALAALVISAVLTLFHPRQILALWRMNRSDGVIAAGVFILALLTKPDYALLIGVLASLIFFLWKTMHPRIVRISKDPVHKMFVNADLFNTPSCPQILHLRTDNVIYFANAEYSVDKIFDRLEQQETSVKFLLVDFSAIGFIDMTGIEELKRLTGELKAQNIQLAIMEIRKPVLEAFDTSSFTDEITSKYIVANKGEAIIVLFKELDHQYCRNVCPHTLFHECTTVK